MVIDAHRPLDLDNVAEGNASVLVLRDSRERVPSADGSGAEAFPSAAADASGSDRDDDDGGSGADEEGNDAGEGACAAFANAFLQVPARGCFLRHLLPRFCSASSDRGC